MYYTHDVASTDVPLSQKQDSALWFPVCCIVTPKRQMLTKLVRCFILLEFKMELNLQPCRCFRALAPPHILKTSALSPFDI